MSSTHELNDEMQMFLSEVHADFDPIRDQVHELRDFYATLPENDSMQQYKEVHPKVQKLVALKRGASGTSKSLGSIGMTILVSRSSYIVNRLSEKYDILISILDYSVFLYHKLTNSTKPFQPLSPNHSEVRNFSEEDYLKWWRKRVRKDKNTTEPIYNVLPWSLTWKNLSPESSRREMEAQQTDPSKRFKNLGVEWCRALFESARRQHQPHVFRKIEWVYEYAGETYKFRLSSDANPTRTKANFSIPGSLPTSGADDLHLVDSEWIQWKDFCKRNNMIEPVGENDGGKVQDLKRTFFEKISKR